MVLGTLMYITHQVHHDMHIVSLRSYLFLTHTIHKRWRHVAGRCGL